MAATHENEDPRRRWLVSALGTGLSLGAWSGALAQAQPFLGRRPGPLPAGRSVYRLSGAVSVNRVAATLDTAIRPGDVIETGSDGEIIFVMGIHAMILRARSKLTVQGESTGAGVAVMRAMSLAVGKLLTVSRDSRTRISTPTAAIALRGTGWYLEAEPDQTYFCTCYGAIDVQAVNDARSRETIRSRHHDRPVYILGEAPEGQAIRDAPFLNHTDQELALIEALVGRLQPNIFPKDSYGGPRRTGY